MTCEGNILIGHTAALEAVHEGKFILPVHIYTPATHPRRVVESLGFGDFRASGVTYTNVPGMVMLSNPGFQQSNYHQLPVVGLLLASENGCFLGCPACLCCRFYFRVNMISFKPPRFVSIT